MKKNVVKVLLTLMSITKILIMVITIAMAGLLVIYESKIPKAYKDNKFLAETPCEGEVTIYGLKVKINSEELFIPSKLGKYNVTKIGKQSYSSKKELQNITRYYIPNTANEVLYDFFEHSNDNTQIFYTGEMNGITNLLKKIINKNRNIRIYIPGDYYDEYFSTNTNNYENYIFKANVVYYMNYLEEDYYYVDYYENGEKIKYEPLAPSRKDYKFDGWYLESDCLNKWCFHSDVVDTTGENKTVKLYAKWTKIKSI